MSVGCEIIDMHVNGQKRLYEFTEEELKLFPVEYLLKNTTTLELLYAWHKLPEQYLEQRALKQRLPCFVHDFYPNGPSSQINCSFCRYAINNYDVDIPEYPFSMQQEECKRKY